MSKILNFLAFVIWIISSLFLAISVIGWPVIMGCEDEWFGIGEDLVRGFKGGEQ
jgi:hypothetical protein